MAWPTNFDAATSKAKAENKFVLAAFTGSDWCPWCQKLKAEVFDKPPFAAAASKRFALVNLDFPHEKKLSDFLKKQNAALQNRYGCYGYPTVLVLTADGDVVARTGYREGGPQAFLKQLAGFLATWQAVVDLRKQLPDAQGIDRRKPSTNWSRTITSSIIRSASWPAGESRSSSSTPTTRPG